jgi:hypothetical protein
MEEEGVEASSSKFDAVFRRGIDHLSAGNPDGSVSALEEALTYYESALARGHLDQARAMADEQAISDPDGGTADRSLQGSLRAAFLPVLAGILLLAGIAVAIVMRRRGRSRSSPTGGNNASATGKPPGRSGPGPTGGNNASATGDRRASASAVAASSVIQASKDQPSGSEEMPARSAPAGMEREQTGGRAPHSRERSESTTWTRSAEYHVPGEPHSPAPSGEAPSAPDADVQATPTSNGKEGHAAGHVPPRVGGGFTPGFCTQCGRSLSQGARFCAYCGHPVG